MGQEDWTGYYVELDEDSSADLERGGRLIHATGSFPGRQVRLIDPPFWPGRWSPSADRFAFTSGSRLFLADRDGAVRSLGELLDLVPAGPLAWSQDHEIVLTMKKETGAGWWLVRIDARTGALVDQRAMPEHLLLESASESGWILAWDARTRGVGDTKLILYEPATEREILPRDGESFGGWTHDGRVIVRAVSGGRWRLEAREPGSSEGSTLSTFSGPFGLPALVHGRHIAVVELQGSRSDSPRAVWLVSPGTESIRLLSDRSGVYYASPSSDGKYVAFSEEVGAGNDVTLRTGIIDVATKRVTYACERDCAVLDLR